MQRLLKSIIACISTVFILSGCDKQYKAESTVKDFLDTNLKTSDYSISFTKVDSTRLVTDRAVSVMRKNANKNTAFKTGIKYNAQPSKKHMFTKAVIRIGNDTIRQTFYLTPDLTQVVSFKDN